MLQHRVKTSPTPSGRDLVLLLLGLLLFPPPENLVVGTRAYCSCCRIVTYPPPYLEFPQSVVALALAHYHRSSKLIRTAVVSLWHVSFPKPLSSLTKTRPSTRRTVEQDHHRVWQHDHPPLLDSELVCLYHGRSTSYTD